MSEQDVSLEVPVVVVRIPRKTFLELPSDTQHDIMGVALKAYWDAEIIACTIPENKIEQVLAAVGNKLTEPERKARP